MSRRVAIVGATGVTGGYALDAAQRLGLMPFAVGRDASRLETFLAGRGLGRDRLRTIDISDSQSVKEALDGIEIVISTVAPFCQNGFAIARAAAELGLGYTDPSGEAVFVRKIIDELDEIALRSGATLCPGNGASAFLGDVAIHSIVDVAQDRVGAVMYDIRGYTPSWGSLTSYMSSILPGGGPRIRNGQLENRPFADYEQRMGGMAGYNSIVPDALVVSRYWTPDHFDGLARKANLPRQLVRLVAATVAQGSVQRVLLRLPFDRWLAYDPVKDARSSVTVHAEVGSGDGTVRRCTIRGEAIYPLTGHILAGTAAAMLDERKLRPAGVRAASEMFDSLDSAIALTGISRVGANIDEP